MSKSSYFIKNTNSL